MLTTKEDRIIFSTIALFISSFLAFIVAFVLTMAGVRLDAFKAGPLELVFVFSVFIALARLGGESMLWEVTVLIVIRKT